MMSRYSMSSLVSLFNNLKKHGFVSRLETKELPDDQIEKLAKIVIRDRIRIVEDVDDQVRLHDLTLDRNNGNDQEDQNNADQDENKADLENKDQNESKADQDAHDDNPVVHVGDGSTSQQRKIITLKKAKKDIVELINCLLNRDQTKQLDIQIANKIYEADDLTKIQEAHDLMLQTPTPIISENYANNSFESINRYLRIELEYAEDDNDNIESNKLLKHESFMFKMSRVMYLDDFSVLGINAGTNCLNNSLASSNLQQNNLHQSNSATDNSSTADNSYNLWQSTILTSIINNGCRVLQMNIKIHDNTVNSTKVTMFGKTAEFKNNEAVLNFNMIDWLKNKNQVSLSHISIYFKTENPPSRPIPITLFMDCIHLSNEVVLSIADNYKKLEKIGNIKAKNKHDDKDDILNWKSCGALFFEERGNVGNDEIVEANAV